MREILFRGKTKGDTYTKYGEWIYSTSIMQDKNQELLSNEVELFNGKRWVAVIPETVGPFTGLTDKNGKKIFEGDICKDCWGTKVVMCFYDSFAQFRAKNQWSSLTVEDYGDEYGMEIIGNIHDNPELLEANNEK